MTFSHAPRIAGGARCTGLLAGAGAHAADSWPDKPITLIVPFATGGPTDILGRIGKESGAKIQ